MDQNRENVVWINNSRTTWPTQSLTLFLSSFDNLPVVYIIFQTDVNIFEIRAQNILTGGGVRWYSTTLIRVVLDLYHGACLLQAPCLYRQNAYGVLHAPLT